MNRQNGFTLIEMMVVVAIIGFLTIVAVPGYSNYMREQKFSEVPLILEAAKGKSEQNFGDARTYVGGNCATAGTKSWTVSCTGDTRPPVSGSCPPIPDPSLLSIAITGNPGDSNVAGYVFNETTRLNCVGGVATKETTKNTVVPGTGTIDGCFVLKKNGSC